MSSVCWKKRIAVIAKTVGVSTSTVSAIDRDAIREKFDSLIDFEQVAQYNCPICESSTCYSPCPICAARSIDRRSAIEDDASSGSFAIDLAPDDYARYVEVKAFRDSCDDPDFRVVPPDWPFWRGG